MATLPSNSSLTGATTTNAQQKANFASILTFLSDLLGTDSSNKSAARSALGVAGISDFGAVRGANGSVKIPAPNGILIINWGLGLPSTGGSTITFPTAYASAPYIVIGGKGAATANQVWTSAYTATNFAFVSSGSEGNVQPWIAIGPG